MLTVNHLHNLGDKALRTRHLPLTHVVVPKQLPQQGPNLHGRWSGALFCVLAEKFSKDLINVY